LAEPDLCRGDFCRHLFLPAAGVGNRSIVSPEIIRFPGKPRPDGLRILSKSQERGDVSSTRHFVETRRKSPPGFKVLKSKKRPPVDRRVAVLPLQAFAAQKLKLSGSGQLQLLSGKRLQRQD